LGAERTARDALELIVMIVIERKGCFRFTL
jgi:hypothetical protein